MISKWVEWYTGRLGLACQLASLPPTKLPVIGLYLAVALAAIPPLAGRAADGGPGILLLESSDTGLRLRVAPVQTERIVLVGIPADAAVSARLVDDRLPLELEVALTGHLRDQPFAAVHLRSTGPDIVIPSADIEITWQEREGNTRENGVRPEHPVWEPVLARALVNYGQARSWRQKPISIQENRFSSDDSPRYRIRVSADGLYRLTLADLAAAGLPTDTLDPATLRLLDDGVEVPLWEDGDAVLFYGQQRRSRYGEENVYWLTYGGASGTRLLTRSVPPTGDPATPTYTVTVRFEKNQLYRSQLPMQEGADHWYWENFQNNLPALLTIDPPGVASGDYSATLHIALQGYTSYTGSNPDHHTRVLINGHTAGDVTWNGQEPVEAALDFPANWLDGNENIEARVIEDTGASTDVALVNWFELTYRRTPIATGDALTVQHNGAAAHDLTGFTGGDILLLDIADPAAPIWLVDAQHTVSNTLRFNDTSTRTHVYLAAGPTAVRTPTIVQGATSDWRTPSQSADYIAIAPAGLHDALQPLLDFRASQGLRVVLADVQDVYDEFSDGELSSEAIRDFLVYAYKAWQPPAPSYVLLVGDGHYDFRDNLATGAVNLLPPYLALADPWLGETAADTRYVAVSGDDPLPDMALGRLPVNSSSELDDVVSKILAYENTGAADWQSRALFVADDTDGVNDFAAHSDLVADHLLPEKVAADKIYYNVTHSTPESVRTAAVTAINKGALLVNFVGHGWINYWAEEQLFGLSDLAQLHNSGRYPVFLAMTCWEGYYHMPDYPSLAESLVRAPGKGAVASWSPTGQGVATGHDWLHQGWHTAVFDDGITHLGPAGVAAQVAMYLEAPHHVELIDTYVLLGDPATRLAYWPEKIFLPMIGRMGK